ncbi:MAG: hypothetical protein QNK23_07725 [Crocinitomicaceae bacterium]|nr:hypothetical protein [Crocinitomicaceae bacterium]
MIRSAIFSILFIIPFGALCTIDDNTISTIDFVQLEARTSANVVHFKWDVNSEINGATFFIEKSGNGDDWKEIEEIPSLGNHIAPHTYRTSEINSAENALEYFRIKRVDKFGNASIMDQVEIEHATLLSLSLIPSLKSSKKQLIVSYNSLIITKGVLRVLDQDDNILEEIKVNIDKGYNRLVINTKNYLKQRYTVVLVNADGGALQKIYEHGKKIGKTKF